MKNKQKAATLCTTCSNNVMKVGRSVSHFDMWMKPVRAQMQKRVAYKLILWPSWVVIWNHTDRRSARAPQKKQTKHVSLHVKRRDHLTCPSGWSWRPVPGRKTGSETLEDNFTVKLMHVCKWPQYSQVLPFAKEALENTETSDKFRDTQTPVVISVKFDLPRTFILNFLMPGII